MTDPTSDDPLLDLVLAGTPERVTDVAAPTAEARAGLDSTKAVLAQLALPLRPIQPSASVRARLEAQLASAPRTMPRRAVIVMDMIVDYLTPGRPLEVPRARAIVPAVRDRIAAARSRGEPVVYLRDEHAPDDPELLAWPVHAVRGSAGAEIWPELAPESGDLVLPHRTYSGFYGTSLDGVLKKLNVDTLVLTGCATEIGMFATATDALMRGYRVEVPPNCQAGASAMTEQATLAMLHLMAPCAPMPASAGG